MGGDAVNGWLGRFLGFLLGWYYYGPGGAVIGLILGNVIDRGFNRGRYYSQAEQKYIQDTYFRVTFQVMGHVAKSDGRVSENEIRAAKNVMDRMRLSKAQRQLAVQYFNQGKESQFNLSKTLDELVQRCHRQKVLLQMFVEIQFTAAKVDGLDNHNKRRILEVICSRLGYRPIFYYQDFGYQQKSRPEQQTSNHDYQLLDISEKSSNAEIKRAYRRQMSRNHPDKLIAQGLPDEMIKIATNKTQQIQAAYERIRKARGF